MPTSRIMEKSIEKLDLSDAFSLIIAKQFQKLFQELEKYRDKLEQQFVKHLGRKMAEAFYNKTEALCPEELNAVQSIVLIMANNLHLWPIDIESSFTHITMIKRYLTSVKPDVEFTEYETLYDLIKMNSLCFSTVSPLVRAISSIYAQVWNHMRESQTKSDPSNALYLATLSLRWLSCLGTRSTEMILGKINQLHALASQLDDKSFVVEQFILLEEAIATALERQSLSGYGIVLDDSIVRLRRSIAMLIVEALMSSEEPFYSQLLLSKTLWDDHTDTISQLGHFDYLDIPTSVSWELKWTDQRHSQSNQMNVMDYIKCGPDLKDQSLKCQQVCRFELNAYFACRGVRPHTIVKLGQNIRKFMNSDSDFVLGYIVEAVGYWWSIDTESQIGLNICKRTISFIETVEKDDIELFFITPLAKTWLALHYLRRYQIIVNEEAEELKTQVITAMLNDPTLNLNNEVPNPNKSYPFVSSLNLHDDYRISKQVIEAVNELTYLLELDDDILKLVINNISIAFVEVTIRLLAHLATAVGDFETIIKVWAVARRIGKLTTSNYLIMTSCYELIRLLHHVDKDVFDDLNYLATSKVAGNSKGILLRRNLAMAHYFYWKKEYERGMKELVIIFDYVKQGENYDVILHLIGDACVLLHLYKENYPKYKNFISEVQDFYHPMSSFGLLSKAFKNITHSVRVFQNPEKVLEQGWHDILFNCDLLNSLFNLVPYFLDQIEESEKCNLYNCYFGELICIFQNSGFALRIERINLIRTLEILSRLSKIDLLANSVESCEVKIEAIQMLTKVDAPIYGNQESCTLDLVSKEFKLLEFTNQEIKIINRLHKLRWTLKTLFLPDPYYPMKGGKDEATRDCSPTFPNKRFTISPILSHPFHCRCFFCLNPRLADFLIETYTVNSRYAVNGGKMLAGLVLFEQAKIFYVKMLLKSIFKYSTMDEFTPEELVKNCDIIFEQHFLPKFTRIGLKILDSQMENTPGYDTYHITSTFHQAFQFFDVACFSDKKYSKLSFEEIILQLTMNNMYKEHMEIRKKNFFLVVEECSNENEPKYPEAKTPEMIGISAPAISPKNKKMRRVVKPVYPPGTRFPDDEPQLIHPIRPLVFSPEKEENEEETLEMETPKIHKKTRHRPI